ncbi:MAG: ChuX/HutX family heme-like substrate-binding protein [Pseudomonadota bacterium]
MNSNAKPHPEEIRQAIADNPKKRERDLAESLGISEAQLLAAQLGQAVKAINPHPDHVMPCAETFGEVMALTRNPSCVHEKVGRYENYHPGNHAAMVLTEDIDLRIFPSNWCHGFMVEKELSEGDVRRSLQVFDAAGDAVHKIFLREGSDLSAWEKAKTTMAVSDVPQDLEVAPRKPAEAPKADVSKVDTLRKEWGRMTDTHQFMRLTSKLKMNRLGAYRIAGEPMARPLPPSAVNTMLEKLQESATEVMLFVGNRGCIQIHTGALRSLRPMGPWQNVMDPRFNLHLRLDHVAEVWAVDKPTQRGAAMSVEAFDEEGALIFQVFGVPKEGRDSRPAWRALVGELETQEQENV